MSDTKVFKIYFIFFITASFQTLGFRLPIYTCTLPFILVFNYSSWKSLTTVNSNGHMHIPCNVLQVQQSKLTQKLKKTYLILFCKPDLKTTAKKFSCHFLQNTSLQRHKYIQSVSPASECFNFTLSLQLFNLNRHRCNPFICVIDALSNLPVRNILHDLCFKLFVFFK